MFTHLHVHSNYSFHSGTIRVEELPLVARRHGMKAVALTDTNDLSGAVEFYKACAEEGIKPIVGLELRSPVEQAVLLARNASGYKEICDVLTSFLRDCPQVKPKLTLENLIENAPPEDLRNVAPPALSNYLSTLSENVFILSSSISVLEALGHSHRDTLFISLARHERPKHPALRKIYQRLHLRIVATNDVMFGSAKDAGLHKLLRAIGTNTTIETVPEYELAKRSQYFASEAQMRSMLSSEEAFVNVEYIANECNIVFDLHRTRFATFREGADAAHLLRTLAGEGLQRMYRRPSQEHLGRFEQELATIEQLNATNYFLAVWDMIGFARHKNFPFLGRGSGANSFIAYLLGISNVDPIENGLRFERFLNPERLSPPDFDIDFSWTDRYEVIDYLLDKYGRANSAMLCTVSTYRDKGGVRQVGKALGYSDTEIAQFHYKLGEAYYTQSAVDSKGRLHSGQQNMQFEHDWVRLATAIQGFPSHLSVHAGGVILADRAITHYTPTQAAPIGVPITQQDMFSAEDWGLVKLDVLATRGLGTFWDTMKIVEEREGVRPPVDDVRVATMDEATRALIREGRTIGCFYIESPAMRGLLRKLACDTFPMLTAASSVIRPGVASSGMMGEFIRRHHDPSARTHLHPKLGELMPQTYGVMVYQEDVLTVAHEIAGLSYGEADLFRRAMSGKLRSQERMAAMEGRFVNGCLERGIELAVGKEIWRQVASFSGYSFCKAHSASYAVLSFQKAWLKVYYPAEFICSVLNNQGGFYRHQVYIDEAKHLGVRVLLPDVNASEYKHTVDASGAIRLGFVAFRDVSIASLERLLHERERSGPYRSVEDFVRRSGVTPEDGKLLIRLGALESVTKKRAASAMEFALLARKHPKAKRAGETLLLDLELPAVCYPLDHLSEHSRFQIFMNELSAFGYSVTDMPTRFLADHLAGRTPTKHMEKFFDKRITLVGYVAATKRIATRKGEPMSMHNISDEFGMADVVIWPRVFRQYFNAIAGAHALRISGTVQEQFGVGSLIAEQIERLDYSCDLSHVGVTGDGVLSEALKT